MSERTLTATYVQRTAADPVGTVQTLVVHLDGRAHELPHRRAVYTPAGEFVGEVIAQGGVYKPTLTGAVEGTTGWAYSLTAAMTNLGLMACGNL